MAYRSCAKYLQAPSYAKSYANIFMGKLENKILQTTQDKPLDWARFIDDINSICTESKSVIQTFHDFINNIHPTIKFFMTTSDTSIPFLDVKQYIDKDGNIETDLYTKPTDLNQYLPFSSSHPRHTKTGIPYG
ncbi:uncharacterized protein [Ptychodera flava]|uniref:uncharacterized protein n=1 Tax=Ptychodera flava TaxID=63121 RepID=UPI00396A4A29